MGRAAGPGILRLAREAYVLPCAASRAAGPSPYQVEDDASEPSRRRRPVATARRRVTESDAAGRAANELVGPWNRAARAHGAGPSKVRAPGPEVPALQAHDSGPGSVSRPAQCRARPGHIQRSLAAHLGTPKSSSKVSWPTAVLPRAFGLTSVADKFSESAASGGPTTLPLQHISFGQPS